MENSQELIDTMKNLEYGFTMAVNTLVTAMGMHAENLDRINRGESIAYGKGSFDKLIEENGTHHNGVYGRRIS